MRSFRKLPELCLFLYFGKLQNHFAAMFCQDVTRPNTCIDPGMYGTYLIAKDQLYLDKACRVNLANWLVENGWNASFCSSTFDTHGNQLLEDIRNKVKSPNEI